MLTDHIPDAQRWNAVPVLTQCQYPSGVQGVPGVIRPRAGLVGAGGMTVVEVERVVDLRVVFLVVVGVGTVMKTPPGLEIVSKVQRIRMEGHTVW